MTQNINDYHQLAQLQKQINIVLMAELLHSYYMFNYANIDSLIDFQHPH